MTEPMTLRARLDAPLKAAYHALTDPGEMRVWLAEHAEVELPHRYEFWGRHTPEGDAPHQRLLHADERSLRFTWLLDGEETTVEIGLEEEGPDSTIITLSQTHWDFQDALTGAGIRGVLQTYWCLAIANLADHLAGRELTAKLDFTSPDLRGEVLIDAARERVFESLIDSEQASAWFGYPIGIEPWVGGRFAMGGLESGHAAKILELEPAAKVTIDWGGGAGVSTWELADSGGKTRLTFVQSGFDASRPPYAAWAGTVSGIAELRRYHEIPDWRPIWIHDAA
ncbi:uncharacterized protein YndB with AHSA1/START domain [Thermocatellispora tengchongensis]|uniref:Uncharacterized protein YndB with AHSA1/START domain n=1 Tax=Thermocatellispora tengchongensis TaxID=1073253 RepID=A0A840PMK1_9ACTN|nr:SRPBCC domain-containing protein [Thermocatellispora tengchongensis]MBB5139011.1 uncharacterized protein YndB with AHSA1/START domain [Thermocatellispora tengchongensis]